MKTKEFLEKLDHDRIVRAIGEAESLTSGELRVFVTKKSVEDPVAAAQQQFTLLGMEKTQQRNGILLFVAPASQKFAVIGDAGINARVGDDFWSSLAGEMEGLFRDSKFTEGIVAGVRKTGLLLAQHFPRRPDDQNELPDAVAGDH